MGQCTSCLEAPVSFSASLYTSLFVALNVFFFGIRWRWSTDEHASFTKEP